jgi:hypothetical protein
MLFFTRAYRVVVHLAPMSSGPEQSVRVELQPVQSNEGDAEEFESGKIMDLRKAMQSVARKGKINLVISDRIQGTVVIATPLEDMTARETLDLIVTSNGLIADEVDGVMFVKTQEERAKEPTVEGQFIFKNARAADVRSLLQSQLQCGIAPEIDERTNTIFFREAKSNLETIYRFLKVIDRPLDQLPSKVVVPSELFDVQTWGDEQLPWIRDERAVEETTPYAGPPLEVDEDTKGFEVGVKFRSESKSLAGFLFVQADGRVTYCHRIPRKDEVQCEEFTIDAESRQSLREAFRDAKVANLAAAYSGESGTLSCDLRCSDGTRSRRIDFTNVFPLEFRVFVNDLMQNTIEQDRPEGATHRVLTIVQALEIERRFFPRSKQGLMEARNGEQKLPGHTLPKTSD